MKAIISLLGLVFITGCASVSTPRPDDPYYAPVIPGVDHAAQQAVSQPGALFTQAKASFLYSDRRASRIGDIIMITLNERTNASKNADTEIKNNDNSSLAPTISGRVPSTGGNPFSFSIDKEKQFKAEADTAQANSLSGTITVTVSQVLPNGNLLIRGENGDDIG